MSTTSAELIRDESFYSQLQESNEALDALFQDADENGLIHEYQKGYSPIPSITVFSPEQNNMLEIGYIPHTHPIPGVQRVVSLRPCVLFRGIIFPDQHTKPRLFSWNSYNGDTVSLSSFESADIGDESDKQAFERVHELLSAKDLEIVDYKSVYRDRVRSTK